MRIALDAGGGDLGVVPNVEGAVLAARELGVEVALAGPEAPIRAELERLGAVAARGLEVVPAPEVIRMEEDPARACREKPQASIMAAARLAAEGKVQGLVSAGHSGATLVAALWHLKRLVGVLRPAVAVPFPTLTGTTVLLDAGANADCKPWHLLQFASMGALYARHVLKVQDPTVALLSNGEEENKGNDLVRDSMTLLRHSGIRFAGPVEGRDLARGAADVVVCDGFVGNVALKTAEGMAGAVLEMLAAEAAGSLRTRLGARLLEPALARIRTRVSDDEIGGAPLLGVGGTVVLAHGRSGARAVFNAIRVARDLVESGVNDKIRTALEQMKSNVELSRVLQ